MTSNHLVHLSLLIYKRYDSVQRVQLMSMLTLLCARDRRTIESENEVVHGLILVCCSRTRAHLVGESPAVRKDNASARVSS